MILIKHCIPVFSRRTDIFVPKFSIKMSQSLKSVLREMGMQDMFGSAADFSGISEDLRLGVSEVRIAEPSLVLSRVSQCLTVQPPSDDSAAPSF